METVVSAAWLAPSLCGGLLVELADSPRQLVAHELLRPLEHLRLGVLEAQARDALELSLLLDLRALQLLL